MHPNPSASRLRELERFRESGRTFAQLAEMAGVPRGYVSNYFRGLDSKVGRPGLKKIRHALIGCGVVKRTRKVKKSGGLPVGCIMP